MSRQVFDTLDVLGLRVKGEPPAGQLANLIKNPRGAGGGWSWVSPVENTTVEPVPSGLNLRTLVAQAAHFETEFIPVKPTDTHVRAAAVRGAGRSATMGVRSRVVFYDADGTQLGQTAQSALITAQGGALVVAPAAVAVGTRFVALRHDIYNAGASPGAGDYVAVTDNLLVSGSLAAVSDGTIAVDQGWVDILGPTHSITVDRAALDLGTLTATILDSTLDPSQATLLRKGRPIRLGQSASTPIFTGEIQNAKVSYHVHPATPEEKRAVITLTAVDATSRLANTPRTEGVATIDDLPYVLEGCGVPWAVMGTSGTLNEGHLPAAPVIVSRNDNAKAIDQVAITRDSEHGFAWVDLTGQLRVWAPDQMSWFQPRILDESVYNQNVVIDFDTERCINSVTLKYLRIDPNTGETEEITYGPYVDDASVFEWGAHAAEFTVHGITEDAATFEAYAAAVLAANATPEVRFIEATIPLNTVDDVTAWAYLDLYDPCEVSNATLGLTDNLRVTTLTHEITPEKWTVKIGFTVDGSVAQPQVTPSPGATGGKTLSQLLRPVGEVTMWFGAAADIPEGWLRCDGAAIPAEFPDLIALVGANTPNMVDVFPIGAGTKALGTTGGNPTKVIGKANLPAIPVRHAANTATGGAAARLSDIDGITGAGGTAANIGAGTPLDVMNPWRALHFIIRAR